MYGLIILRQVGHYAINEKSSRYAVKRRKPRLSCPDLLYLY